ncbi:hypothetical protein QVD17_23058 [Tagetes erecta]|uniref:Uncharacterized protein n=1 Tax=Tagetes erecta TaxID=13708 RepID=A0AAD8KDM0_TARER|nr:hypothetical protein QVD17_23058 [Tagetes erecta]
MNYYGDAAGNERYAVASSSRRKKGKRSHSSYKPKQPQRGLGVAQLEKIRLLNQFAFHPTSNTQHHPQMGMGELERSNMIYGLSQPSSNDTRWNANNAMFEYEEYAQPGTSRHIFQAEVEESPRKKIMSDSMGSSSRTSDSNSSQELDLELRLSL